MVVAADHVMLARDAATGVEAIRARFRGHAYDMHHHDEWLVGVTLHGVQDFHCRRVRQRSTPGRVILIEPGEMHDGEAGADGGFAYEMIYLPQARLAEGMADIPSGRIGFRATLNDDGALAQAVRRFSALTHALSERLAREAALDAVVERLRVHFEAQASPDPGGIDEAVARRARDYLHANMAEDVGSDGLAAAAGASSRFQLARSFRRVFGAAPHAYLVQLRLAAARRMLAEGVPPALVAAECGFADQSHFGRWFRRAYGITPAAYRAGRTGVPDGAGAGA